MFNGVRSAIKGEEAAEPHVNVDLDDNEVGSASFADAKEQVYG